MSRFRKALTIAAGVTGGVVGLAAVSRLLRIARERAIDAIRDSEGIEWGRGSSTSGGPVSGC